MSHDGGTPARRAGDPGPGRANPPTTDAIRGRPATVRVACAFVVALACIAVGRSFTYLTPPSSDGRLYAYIGNAWLHGDVPYLHAWEMKPPGIFALNAAVFALFPESFGALAALEGAALLGCAATLYLLLRAWQVSWVGASLAVVLFAFAANQNAGESNLTELYLFWPAAVSMLLFSKAMPGFRPLLLAAAGVSAGIATLFKLTGLAPLLAQAAYLGLAWLLLRRVSLRQSMGAVAALLSGAALAWLPFIVYFTVRGAAWEMVEASFVYPFHFSGAMPRSVGQSLVRIDMFLGDRYALMVFAFIGATACVVERWTHSARAPAGVGALRGGSAVVLAALWVLADLAAAISGNRSHSQYFLPVALSLAALVGLTYSSHVEARTCSTALRVTVLVLLVLPSFTVHVDKPLRNFVHVYRYGHNLSHDAFSGHDQPTLEENVGKVAGLIAGARRPGDTLFSWDLWPSLFDVLDIKSSVHVLDLAFRRQLAGRMQQQFVERVMAELEGSPPTFIADTAEGPSIIDDVFHEAFSRFVAPRYEAIGDVRMDRDTTLRVYRIRGGR